MLEAAARCCSQLAAGGIMGRGSGPLPGRGRPGQSPPCGTSLMRLQTSALALPLILLHLWTILGADPLMYNVQFAPPTLVGQSNHSDPCITSGKDLADGAHWGTVPCHYWFPISFLQLGTGPSAAFLLGVRPCFFAAARSCYMLDLTT